MSRVKARGYLYELMKGPPPEPDWRKDKKGTMRNWFMDADAYDLISDMTEQQVEFGKQRRFIHAVTAGSPQRKHDWDTNWHYFYYVAKPYGRLFRFNPIALTNFIMLQE